MDRRHGRRMVCLTGAVLIGGCLSPRASMPRPQHADIAPATQPSAADALRLDASQIEPMYRQKLAIDLATVVRVALAENFDIRRARERVKASRGRLESAIGAVFPALVPTAMFEHVDGTVRATEGNLVGVGFNTFQPTIALQWVLNPGRVVYEIIAAKKRLLATERRAEAAVQETLHTATLQYYELILAQARVSTARQAVTESQELLRINQLRLRAGAGVRADELRAKARLAERQQDLALAVNAFYGASVALAVTLHLDAAATLIPTIDALPPIHLVRTDLSIDELLALAVYNRPDLQTVRALAEAVAAEKGATWWGAFGPQFQAGYQYGGITGHANNVVQGEGIPGNLIVNPLSAAGTFSGNPIANGVVKEGILRGSRRAAGRHDQTFGFSDQHRFKTNVGWRFSLSAFGDLKAADAAEQQALIDAERRLDEVRAEVIRATQAAKTNDELIGLAQQQVTAAEEALRLSQANLQAGTMTTLDVLQAEEADAQAHLRYAEAVVRHNQAQVNLLAALGLLSESALTTPSAQAE